jgi:tellurite resistance protein TerC
VELVGDRFTVVKNGVRHATPLLLALLTIETADAIFAIDSVPAVIGITTDRFIVFTSNLFAVLGLRSLYFALAGLLDQLRYLKHGLVGVLGIIGAKMLLAWLWPMPTWLSLVSVTTILGAAVVASLVTSTETRNTNAEQS